MNIDFKQSSLVNNNLDGQGPLKGPPEMRFVGIIRDYQGEPIDLVITATSAYRARNIRSTRLRGRFGQINLAGGSSVDLNFRFVKSATDEAVWLPKFAFTFSDIDQGWRGRASETVEVDGFDRFVVVAGHELAVNRMSSTRMSFSSTKRGGKCDNPRQPLQLREVNCKGRKVDQAKRSVMLLFTKTHNFNATFHVGKSRHGRLLAFAGLSSLSAECSSPTSNQCTDTRSDWSDDLGNDCDKYASLSGGEHCTKYGHEDYSKGPANAACCACGGGSHPGTGPHKTNEQNVLTSSLADSGYPVSIRTHHPTSLLESQTDISRRKRSAENAPRLSRFLAPKEVGLTLTQSKTMLSRKPPDCLQPSCVDEL